MERILRIFTGVVFIVLLHSCDYGILYENPQPAGLKNLQSFPDYYIGNYRDDSLDVTVSISKNRIIKITEYDVAVSRAEIDTMDDCRLTGDSLYLSDLDESIHVDLTSDSVFGKLSRPDTVFSISERNILRNYKRDCFLNMAHDSGFWQVVKLSELKDNIIEFSVITQKVDFNRMKNFTPVKQITEKDSVVNYMINPTRKELKAIIKAGFFEKREKYKKLQATQ